MKKVRIQTLRHASAPLALGLAMISAPSFAQAEGDCPTGQMMNADGVCQEEVAVPQQQSAPSSGDIVVTGSRIKRDTYSSISPIQVITTEATQDAGLFDSATILQRSEASSGQQIDATFQGFVLNNGPGSSTVNLRGLGADRTLLLVNGRRLAPAGVEGAPTNPSINLLPSSLIERYELLTDGASSIYGSDAVAGVGNVILRKDFDGVELYADGNINPMGGGDDYTVSAAWGMNSDRGFFGIGAEYAYNDAIKLKDRDFLAGCDTHYEITNTGEIRTIDVRTNALVQQRTAGVSVSQDACKITGLSGRIFIPYTNYGSVYYTPGSSNTGIPNFSENTIRNREIDANGDGIRDVDFQDYNTNAADTDIDFSPQSKVYNLMAYGEYTLEGEANITPYFEFNYSRAEVKSENSGTPQLFPYVSATNQFNPCFRGNTATGVDCRAVENANYGTGLGGGFDLPVQPIVSVRGDRNNFDVTQEQYRFVGGFKGDLPFISPSWTFDVSGVYSKSIGKSFRRGIREDKLAFALGIDPTADFDDDGVFDNDGDGIADDYNPNLEIGGIFGGPVITACNVSQLANPSAAMADLAQGCVPVNMFAQSLLGVPIGDFATQAERDYLFGTRSFDTTYEQILLSGYATGTLFKLPAGDVKAVFGVEYREDKINSTPSVEASNGLLFGFFADSGAVGKKWIREAYGEVELPLMAGKPLVRDLTVNISGRLTDEQYYGTEGTYSIKGGWRPVDTLQVKMSYGTTFRAPNLRENFLAGQTGFNTLVDPCAVPDAAFVNNAYVASLDTREPTTLANCRREGRDPTRVGVDANNLNTITTTSTEILTGGSLDLKPETSRAITAGFAYEELLGDGFDVGFNFNYYDIKIKGAVTEPSAQFILNDCYTREDGVRSPFCDRITASTSAGQRFLVTDVAAGFINLNEDSVRGIDINFRLNKDVMMFGQNVTLGFNVRGNHLIERKTVFINDTGDASEEQFAGEFGYPKWTGTTTFTADVDRFTFTWQVRYIGPVEQDILDIDEFDDAFGGEGTGFAGDTCLGDGSANGNVAGDGVLCRDVGFAKKYFTHSASIRYDADTWTARIGVTNLFDRAPPKVDSNEVLAIANTPIGNGYDLDGREFFMSVSKKF